MQRLRPMLTPWRAVALALLLLAAQALGLAHHIAHGPVQAAPGHASAVAQPHGLDSWGPARMASVHQHAGHAHAADTAHDHEHCQNDRDDDGNRVVSDDGHSHSEGSAECRLYDQLLSHADVLLAAALPPPLPAPAVRPLARAEKAPGRSTTAPYQARAPPLA